MNNIPANYPENIDLENCSKEPIHIIGKTQSFGVLLVCDPLSFNVIQAGINTPEHFSLSPKEIIGQPLTTVLGEEQVENLRSILGKKETLIPQEVSVKGKKFLLQAHFSEINLILDFEPIEEIKDPFFFQKQLTRVLNKIQDSNSINELCNSAAVLTREIFGYDRVMIYKFDEEWNGQVLAENKVEELESWLGLHYPSTDIPSQSREMFLKHQIRMISDVQYTPVRIEPELSPLTGKPLDLSKSGLRAVSPIHIEYLTNMEVGASLSAAIIVQGKLWGLIACHHRTPRFLNYYQRESCRFLAQMLSTELALHESNNFINKTEVSGRVLTGLVDQLKQKGDIIEALSEGPVRFTDLISCTGGAIYFGGKWKLQGNVPSTPELEILMNNFLLHQEAGIYHTRNLATVFTPASDYQKEASGLLSLRITESKYILWFRQEVIQTVSWGGDPNDKTFYNEEKKRLSPRKSFKKWSNERKGISEDWKDFDVSAARDLGDKVSHTLLSKQRKEITGLNRKLMEANKDLELFSFGLSHDLRAPIRGMEGYLQIIKEDHAGKLNKEGKNLLNLASALTGKMNSLIDDILSYSGLSGMNDLQFQEIPVENLLKEVLSLINAESNFRRTRIHIEENLSPMKGDRRMLFQLWLNIVNNALKYSEKVDTPEIKIGTVQKNGKEVYYVRDNGIGIEENYLEKIFKTFTRVAGKDYSGSGIGLAIVKKIIEKHKGDIWVESIKGEGATFYFYTCPNFEF